MRRAILPAMSLLGLVLLTACTSTEESLNPAAIAPEPAQPAAPTAVAGEVPVGDGTGDTGALPSSGTTAAPAATAQVAAVASAARVQFAPIVGATVEAVTPLTQQLSVKARERGLRLVPSGDASTTHMMKGYFSALSEDSGTTVIYVWDVVDAAGNRLHRIQGQERATGSNGEGWAAVPPAMMQAIANRTIEDLVAWLASRPS